MKNRILTGFVAILMFCSFNIFAQNVGISSGAITPNTRLDVDGDIALREGTPLNLANGANNNVAVGAYSFYRITGPTGAFSVSGLTGGQNGKMVTLYNTTTQVMTIVNDATSDAANRIYTLTGSNVVTPAGPNVITLQYNAAVSRWLLISGQNIITTGGGGGVHAMTSSDHTAGNWKVFYSNGAGEVIELGLGAAGEVLTSAGAVAAPTWEVPAGGGGAHAMTSADHTAGNWKLFYSNGAGEVVELGLGSAGRVLTSAGAAAIPSWTDPIEDITDLGAGNWKVFYSNGAGEVVEIGLGGAGEVLMSTAPNAAPEWRTLIPTSRTLTMTGVANETDITGEAQNLSANREWTIGLADNAILPGTGAVTVPSSTTDNRPGAPTNGMVRYNTTTSKFEFYQGGAWTNFVGTLDDAYNFGGAGAGRTINANSGPVLIQGTTDSVVLRLSNTNANGVAAFINTNSATKPSVQVVNSNGTAITAWNLSTTSALPALQSTSYGTMSAIISRSYGTDVNSMGVYGIVDVTGAGSAGVYGANERTTGGSGVYGIGFNGAAGFTNYGAGFGLYGYNAGLTAGNKVGVYGVGYCGVRGFTNDVINGWGGFFDGDAGATGTFYGSQAFASDIRFKSDIQQIDSALSIIKQLNGKFYKKEVKQRTSRLPMDRNDEVEEQITIKQVDEFGLIAQDVELILPQIVSEKATLQFVDGDTTQYKHINYISIIPILIEAMKEQQTMIEALQNEVGTLREEVDILKSK